MGWNELGFPKCEGGLGLRNLETWNKASILKHLWSSLTDPGSLWVAWAKQYLLKGHSLWALQIPVNVWSWGKFLKLREDAMPHINWRVGAGHKISSWHATGQAWLL